MNISEWNLPKIEFADQFFPIDILIGTEHFFNILSGDQQSLGQISVGLSLGVIQHVSKVQLVAA